MRIMNASRREKIPNGIQNIVPKTIRANELATRDDIRKIIRGNKGSIQNQRCRLPKNRKAVQSTVREPDKSKRGQQKRLKRNPFSRLARVVILLVIEAKSKHLKQTTSNQTTNKSIKPKSVVSRGRQSCQQRGSGCSVMNPLSDKTGSNVAFITRPTCSPKLHKSRK